MCSFASVYSHNPHFLTLMDKAVFLLPPPPPFFWCALPVTTAVLLDLHSAFFFFFSVAQARLAFKEILLGLLA